MEPLKISIELQTPMVEPGEIMHLDALLGALKVKQVKKKLGEGINPRDYHHDIPVDRYTTASGQWVFKASAFQLASDQTPQMWMHTGRLNLAQAAQHRNDGFLRLRAAKVALGGGAFKTSLFHFPITTARLTAYCRGDKQGIEALLVDCQQVGGRRGTGFGQVSSITVESVPESECNWMRRALPSDADVAKDSHALAIAALHAPYWDRALHQPVLMPTN